MKIVICGSMSSSKEMINIKNELLKLNHKVILPRNTEKYANDILKGENAHESTQNKIKYDLIRGYFNQIKNSDAVLVVNVDKNGIKNHIGGNTFLELGFAHVLNKKIFLLNDIPDVGYKDELLAMQPVVLKGKIKEIS